MKRICAGIAVFFFLTLAMLLLVSKSSSQSLAGRDPARFSPRAIRVDTSAMQMDDVLITGTRQVFLPIIVRSHRAPKVGWEFRGASVAGYWSSAYAPAGNARATIDYPASIGANSVAVMTTWYQDSFTSTVMYPDPRITPDDEELGALIDYAHSKGLKVMLKPHVDPLDKWRGEIQPTDPAAWFQHFKDDFILHYAQLAQDHQAEVFCLGAEYDTMTMPTDTMPGGPWEGIIAGVRQVYDGKLTYAATEGRLKDADHPIPASFWQSLDYAALTVYFNVSPDRTPQVADTVAAWNSDTYRGFLEDWHAQHGRPIIFAEIGYRSVDYAGFESYRTEGPNGCSPGGPNYPECSIAYNGEGQANLYQALFEAMGRQPSLAGIFAWQFEPRAACREVTGGVGNIDFSFYGKPAGQVIQDWFGGPGDPPALTYPDLTAPLIDHFDYLTDKQAQNVWLVQSSGDMALTPETDTYAPVAGNTRSMRIDSQVPAADPRYAQLVGYFCEGHRDWSKYHSLEIWVRTDGLRDEPSGAEFSIALIDSRSAGREIWQSSRYLDRWHDPDLPDGWIRARVALSGRTERDPWRHPTDFVVPEWESLRDGILDLNALRGIWIKTLTTQDAEQYPDFTIWVDESKVSTDTVSIIPAPTPPILESFEYENADDARFVWKHNPDFTGTISISMDTSPKAPVADTTRSMAINSDVPCGAGGLADISNYFLGGPLDLSAYGSLELWVRGDQVNEEPYGGEFSVILIDGDGERWQSTRWLDRTTGANAPVGYQNWDHVRLSLTASADRDPWLHPADFVIPSWTPVGNGVLDLDQVRGISIKSRTTDQHCSQYPQRLIWVDALQASAAAVEPPTQAVLPDIDPFEYKDDDIARIIWKSASSGRAVISMDPTQHAPIAGSTQSIKIESHVPCATGRHAEVCATFLNGPLDVSPYSHLEISVRGDGINAAPWGGEFSILLIEQEADGPEEKWQSTRWLDRTDTWSQPIGIGLSGSGQGNPWDHPNDFAVPTWEQLQDGILNLQSIKAVCIKALTTDESCNYPDFAVRVDGLTLK